MLTINAATTENKHKIQDADSLSQDSVLSEIMETMFVTVI